MDETLSSSSDSDSAEIEDRAQHLALDLAAAPAAEHPLPSPRAPRADSWLSSASADHELLETLVQRVDQVARLNQEQWQAGERTMQEMRDTMQLAQLMIALQDEQQQEFREHLDRQEQQIQALIRINQNLSAIAAALVA